MAVDGYQPNKSLKYVPALRASTGRGKAAPLNSDVGLQSCGIDRV